MGVRIQELPETTGIKKEDVLIVEDGQGTKKGTVQQLDEALGVSQLKEDLANLNVYVEDSYLIDKLMRNKNVFYDGSSLVTGDNSARARTVFFYPPVNAIGLRVNCNTGYRLTLFSTYDNSTLEGTENIAEGKTLTVYKPDNTLRYIIQCIKLDDSTVESTEIPFTNEWVYAENDIVKSNKNKHDADILNVSNGYETLGMYSELVNGNLRSGEIVDEKDTGYYQNRARVVTKDIICFDRDIEFQIADGYKIGVHSFVDGVFSSDSGWRTGTYKVLAGTEFKAIIAKTNENTGVIADINEFNNAVKIETSVVSIGDDLLNNAKMVQIYEENMMGTSEYLQGGCCDGENMYYAYVYNTWGLRKTNISSKSVVTEIDKNSGGGYYAHANDMTYDSAKDRLIIAYTTHDSITFAEINPSTLRSVTTYSLTNDDGEVLKAFGVAYDRIHNLFYVGEEDNFGVIHVFNSEFKKLYTITLSEYPNYTHQNIETDGKYIYMLFNSPDCIYVYDLNGKLVKVININSMNNEEIESISYDWNGNFYLMTSIYNNVETRTDKIYYGFIKNVITLDGLDLLIN